MKITGENLDLQEEDFAAGKAVSESNFATMAKITQWVKENFGDFIGKVQYAALTEAQFAAKKGYEIAGVAEADKKWVIMKGQSIVGSQYATETGITTLPDALGNGAHFAQMRAGNSMLEYQANQNQAHTHNVTHTTDRIAEGGGTYDFEEGTSFGDSVSNVTKSTTSSGDSEARPNRVLLNVFIMINN